jgi:hypothetical protein
LVWVPFRLGSQRLPINVQLVARWFDETTALLIEAASEFKIIRPDL